MNTFSDFLRDQRGKIFSTNDLEADFDVVDYIFFDQQINLRLKIYGQEQNSQWKLLTSLRDAILRIYRKNV